MASVGFAYFEEVSVSMVHFTNPACFISIAFTTVRPFTTSFISTTDIQGRIQTCLCLIGELDEIKD